MAKINRSVRLGKKLKNYRLFKGYTQEEVARKMKFNRLTLVRIEQGKKEVGAIELMMLSKIYGVDISYFLE